MLHSSADFALIAFHIVEHAVEKQKSAKVLDFSEHEWVELFGADSTNRRPPLKAGDEGTSISVTSHPARGQSFSSLVAGNK